MNVRCLCSQSKRDYGIRGVILLRDISSIIAKWGTQLQVNVDSWKVIKIPGKNRGAIEANMVWANAWVVAVWNAMRFAWLALVWANWASACALRRVDMSAAMSRPPGTATGAGNAGTGTTVLCVPESVGGGMLGLQYPQLSPQGSSPSSSRAGPPKRRSNWVGGRDAVQGGGGLDAPGRWPSQAAVATERVTLLYATRFQVESAALTGLGAVGSGDLQARATLSPNARKRRRSAAVSHNNVISWSIRRYATPMGYGS
jgi:hypothetical protein